MKEKLFYHLFKFYFRRLHFLQRKAFEEHFRYISSFIQPNNSVLQPACGLGVLADFLPSKLNYRGFDDNIYVVKYAQDRGLNVYFGHILNLNNYHKSDVVVTCDLINRLNQSQKEDFINLLWSFTRKMLITCEPKKHSDKIHTQRFLDKFFSDVYQLQKSFDKYIITVFFKDKESWEKFSYHKTVTAIVPVYNEERTVDKVVDVLLNSPLIQEVICVNDGSKDNSLKILRNFGPRIKLINLRRNRGKGFALATGVQAAQGEIVAFFDADILNLNEQHINNLLRPILMNRARSTLGIRDRDSFWTYLGGERAFYRKDLLPLLPEMRDLRFGVEMLLNRHFQKHIQKVYLDDLRILLKYQKHSPIVALKEYIKEAAEVTYGFSKAYGVVPDDFRIIKKLKKVSNVKEFRLLAENIQNKHLRQFLKHYIFDSLEKIQAMVKD